MTDKARNIDSILSYSDIQADGVNKYEGLGLSFNPFPRSGTANMNSNDSYTASLIPVNDETLTKVSDYIKRALVPNVLNPDDKLITGVVIGNYGMGKTQLMLYIKALLSQAYQSKHSLINNTNPYVVYIDNPGVSITELIGSIIKNIGEENFKKFLWKNIVQRIDKNPGYKERLKRYDRSGSLSMFDNDKNGDPFHESNKVNYKLFIDAFISKLSVLRDRRAFEAEIKKVITETLHLEFKDAVLAEYFYDIVSNDLGINVTWEAFISGSGKHLEGKESDIIKVIFRIVKEQGFTHFFVLVDEFEDISQGRLPKNKLDNYLYNLRILVDDNREWCLLFAMVPDALRQIRKISPPLAQRISTITIELNKLSNDDASSIISNYLSLAKDTNDVKPFTTAAIASLNQRIEIDGTPRTLLQSCFALIEEASDAGVSEIDEAFIQDHLTF